jgi:hypothetical protein
MSFSTLGVEALTKATLAFPLLVNRAPAVATLVHNIQGLAQPMVVNGQPVMSGLGHILRVIFHIG